MLTASDGTLKIVDFGVSEMFSPSNDKLRTSAGSPAFSAPEVCVGMMNAWLSFPTVSLISTFVKHIMEHIQRVHRIYGLWE